MSHSKIVSFKGEIDALEEVMPALFFGKGKTGMDRGCMCPF
jgi:hypothetical protein